MLLIPGMPLSVSPKVGWVRSNNSVPVRLITGATKSAAPKGLAVTVTASRVLVSDKAKPQTAMPLKVSAQASITFLKNFIRTSYTTVFHKATKAQCQGKP